MFVINWNKPISVWIFISLTLSYIIFNVIQIIIKLINFPTLFTENILLTSNVLGGAVVKGFIPNYIANFARLFLSIGAVILAIILLIKLLNDSSPIAIWVNITFGYIAASIFIGSFLTLMAGSKLNYIAAINPLLSKTIFVFIIKNFVEFVITIILWMIARKHIH